MAVEWNDRLPTPDSTIEGIRIYRVPGNYKVYARLLDEVLWIKMHWSDGRTFPCQGSECPLCPLPIRWKGYVAAQISFRDERGDPTWRLHVLELNHTAGRELGDRDTKGLLVYLEREGSGRSAPIKLTICAEQRKSAPPPGWDIRPLLMRLWGLREPVRNEVLPEEDGQIIPMRRHA